MKAQLEAPCKNRGIILKAENKEDEAILRDLWHHKGRVVRLDYEAGKVCRLLIAPTEEKGETE